MSDVENKNVIEEESSLSGRKIVVLGAGVIGGLSLSAFYGKKNVNKRISHLNNFDDMFITIKDVEINPSERFNSGYSRRDYKDLAKGSRYLKNRGRK